MIEHIYKHTEQGELSIHVYGADISVLGTSIRREYELPVRS